MIAYKSTDFYNRVYDLQGEAPAAVLDGYFSLKKPADGTEVAPGLGSDYKPLFNEASVPDTWKKSRFEEEDLERCSVVVPDLSKIQLGDLVVRFGHGGRQSEIGIVVHLAASLPDYRADQRKFMESVIVLSVSDRLRQVTMGTWANSGNTFGGFTDSPEKFHVRRLVARNEVGKDGSYPATPWDVCDLTAVGLNLDVRAMMEMDSGQKESVKERWIPNTGEYLKLTDARLSLTNEAGAVYNFANIKNGLEEVYVAGALDRGYDAAMKGDAYGNIYVNSDCEFEVAIVKGGGSAAKIYKLGVLKKDPDKPWAYRMDYSESAMYDRDGYNLKRYKKDYMGNRLSLTPEGRVTGSFGGTSDFRLAIRPVNSASARPGDDLLLQLGIRSKDKTEADIYTDSTTGKTFSKVATMKESDYIAVYDKKMLWRANLYIDEGAEDWNKMHPWNAPSSGTTGPSWWSNAWGNNQWNRTLTVPSSGLNNDIVLGTPTEHISGKQVVDFSDFPWTPVRPKDRAANAGKSDNYYDDRVAYDYEFESPNFKAMDSPYDFIWKMNRQRRAIRNHFAQYTDEIASQIAEFPNGLNGMLIQTDSNSLFADWLITKAAHNKWKYYWKEPSGGIRSYIPGLGLRYFSGGGTTETATMPGADLGFTDKASAGTDCIGFAQRTASYSGNKYLWDNMYTDLAEGRADPDTAVRNTVFPNCPTDQVKSRTYSDEILYHSADTAFTDLSQEKLKKVVVGDVFYWYYNTADSHFTLHIAVVNKVFINAESNVTDIQLVESTYEGDVNFIRYYLLRDGGYISRPYYIVRLRHTN